MQELNFLQLVKNHHVDLDVIPHTEDVTTKMQKLDRHLLVHSALTCLSVFCLSVNISACHGLTFLHKESKCTNVTKKKKKKIGCKVAVGTKQNAAWDTIVGILTHYGLDGLGIETWSGLYFPCHPD
jgi:hypothetical protein